MSDVVFYAGIAWLAILLGVIVIVVARAGSTPTRILALDLLTLVLIGVLALAAGEDGTSYALDAALALALLSFTATLVAARHVVRGRPF